MPDSGDFKLELRELELDLRVATGRTDQMCGGGSHKWGWGRQNEAEQSATKLMKPLAGKTSLSSTPPSVLEPRPLQLTTSSALDPLWWCCATSEM